MSHIAMPSGAVGLARALGSCVLPGNAVSVETGGMLGRGQPDFL